MIHLVNRGNLLLYLPYTIARSDLQIKKSFMTFWVVFSWDLMKYNDSYMMCKSDIKSPPYLIRTVHRGKLLLYLPQTIVRGVFLIYKSFREILVMLS